MSDPQWKQQEQQRDPLKNVPPDSEAAYPASIEKMSEKWREIRQQGDEQPPRNFVERNYLALGIGIALLVIALLVVIGGFVFLIMRAN
jgi:hypothetical protein